MSQLLINDIELSVISKIDFMLQLIEAVEISERSQAPDSFLDLLHDFLTQLKITFILEVKDIKDSGFEEEAELIFTKALTFINIIRQMHEKIFVYMETSEQTFKSSEISFFLKNMTYLSTSTFELSLIPSWEYTYSINAFPQLYQSLCQKVQVDPKDGVKYPDWFLFIKYPSIEAKNIFLNCVLIHEIAHFWDYDKKISDSVIKNIKVNKESFDEQFELLLKEKIPKVEKVTGEHQYTIEEVIGKTSIERDMYEEVNKIIETWLKEIVADLLAIRIFGPAYLYSLIEFSVIVQVMDKYSGSHPSSVWRIKYCLEELKELSFIDKTGNKEIQNYFASLDNYVSSRFREPEAPLPRVAYFSLVSAINNILNEVRRITPEPFDTDSYNSVNEKIKNEYFMKCIPPIAIWDNEKEAHKPINSVFSLNSAWEIYLTEKETFFNNFDINDENDRVLSLHTLNKLTLKAIESSEILKKWQK